MKPRLPPTQDFLQRDPHGGTSQRLLVLLTRYEEGAATGVGAELRQAGLVFALRRLLPTDVVSIVALRQLMGCADSCTRSAGQCDAGSRLAGRRPWPYCARTEATLGRFLEDTDYAAVLLSHVPMHQYVQAVREHTDAPFLVDFHNAEADLEQEMIAHPDYPRLHADDAGEWSGMERVERLMHEAADLVTVPSPVDQQRIIRRYGDRPVFVVPNAVELPDRQPQRYEIRPRTCFFLGALDYFPNTRAALEIIERIGPAIAKEFPEIRVEVAGRRPPELLTREAEASAIRLTADLEDVGQLFRFSVLLVPLDCGGGTRLKILQAFAAGCPVVSTAKGMEGIAAEPGIHYLEAESTQSYVDALRRIIDQPAEDLNRRRNAWNLVRSRYSWNAIVRPLGQVLTTAGVFLD
jgi:polysaccharide biosynthesis protein PslH